VAIIIGLGGLLGCSSEPRQVAAEPELAPACDSLTQAFMGALKGRLTSAIADGGPAFAIEVCNVAAPELASEFSQRPGWQIRRVSDRARNPANAPSAYEARVLRDLAAPGAEPIFREWTASAAGDSVFWYFKTIRVGDLCLNCHGDPEDFDPEVVQTLADNYPEDQATGYASGDFRGALVVTVHAPEGLDAATGDSR
jgi:hypothetical protein